MMGKVAMRWQKEDHRRTEMGVGIGFEFGLIWTCHCIASCHASVPMIQNSLFRNCPSPSPSRIPWDMSFSFSLFHTNPTYPPSFPHSPSYNHYYFLFIYLFSFSNRIKYIICLALFFLKKKIIYESRNLNVLRSIMEN